MRPTIGRLAVVAAGLCLAAPGVGMAQPAAAAKAAPAVAVPKGWENLQKFYDEHEVARDFMPFGMYGYGTGSKFATVQKYGFKPPLFDAEKVTTLMHLDTMIDHNFNSIWGGFQLDPSDDPTISAQDVELYGTVLPRYEIRTLPSGNVSGFRHDSNYFQGLKRRGPPLTPGEMATLEQRLAKKLANVKELAEKFPQTILGFVTDDEPEDMATAVACARLVEKHTGRLVTFTTPNFYNIANGYAAQMMPITGDLYYCGDVARNSWKISADVATLRKDFPGRLFWFMPNVTAWGAQSRTLPDLPDPRPLRTDLRLQCWSALALGTKGFYFFQVGEGFQWGDLGQDGLFDALKRENDHDPRQNLAAELREIGRDFTTIGPSLLTAYPAVTPEIPIACPKVRLPFYRGLALGCGLLRDAREGRDFLVPWNNDLDHEQTGTLTVPAELLGGDRKVYDLHSLRPVELGAGGTFRTTLQPGGGHVYMVGDAKAFAAVRESILRHRVWPDRAKARSLVERRKTWPKTISFQKADGLIASAVAAEKKRDWAAAAKAYGAAVAEMKSQDPLAGIDAIVEKAGAVLSRGDDLVRTHGQHLYNITANNYRGYGIIDQIFGNVPIKGEIGTWISLGARYVTLKERIYAGEVDWAKLNEFQAEAEKLVTEAEAVNRALEGHFDRKYAEIRKPWRVAFVTPDREGVQEMQVYAWAYRQFNVDWIAPDDKGVLRNMTGKVFKPADYDVVWLHQLMSRQPGEEEVKPVPDAVLMKPLLEPAMIKAMKDYVGSGRGLLLTGLSGLYALTLGLEKSPPDVGPCFFHDYKDALAGYKTGVLPIAGAEKHPLFAHVPAAGLATNGGFPGVGWCASTEMVWFEQTPLSGTPLARNLGGQPLVNAAEYALDKGKVLLLGGSGFSLTPGLGNNPAPTRQIMLDGIGYLAGKDRFEVPRAVPK